MTNITLAAYRFFKKHRAAFYIIMLGSFALFALLASRMYYEEDISKLLPSSGKNEGTRFAFEKLKIKDKIFLEFRKNPSCSDEDFGVDNLIAAADEFCDSLKSHDSSGDIDDILYKLDNEAIGGVASLVLDNAPAFLGKNFYDEVDNILNSTAIDSLMNENLALLSSDMGGAYYEIIRHDPLFFRNLAIGGGSSAEGAMGGGMAFVNNHFFAKDSSMAMAFLSPGFKSMDSKAGTRLVDNIIEEIETFEASHPEVEVLFFGAPVQSVFNAKRIKQDLAYTVSFALILICLIIGICFKTKDTLAYLIMPLLYGVVFAIAMVYLIQGEMSFIALGIGTIVVGVALSYCMHIITHRKYVADVEQVIKDQTKPVILGCITTVGSLLGLIFTRSSLLRDFGIMASFVMVGTTLFALFFLPQFFTNKESKKNEKLFGLIEKVTTYPYSGKKWLVALVVLIFAASLILTKGQAKFDTNLVNLGYNEPKVTLADSLYTQKISGGYQTEFYAVFSKDLDSALIFNGQMQHECFNLEDNLNIAGFSNSSDILLPRQAQQYRIDFWNRFWTPEKRAAVKRMVASSAEKMGFEADMFEPFYNSLDKEYKPVDIYASGVIPDAIMSNLIEYTDSTYLVFTSVKGANKAQLNEAGKSILEGRLGEHTIVLNPFFYTTDMLEIMNHDFNTVLWISSLFVFLILLISMRNLLYAIIAFLPMGMSWYIVLGVMAAAGIEFNLINIVISTFIFGMGVDYSIFVMDGLIKGGEKDLLRYHRSAIFFSAVMLILAIASLMFAVHPAISSIGLSTMTGMIATIVITFTLQPYLFYLVSKRNSKKQSKEKSE
ncbi:MAG: MMPL family transporter [Candidatus Egerieousia sp.]